MVPRISPSITSVRLARTTRGSRNKGTPLAMASTPVERAAPGREGAQDEEDGHRLEAARRELGLTHWRLVQPQGVDEPDRDDGEQAEDEDQGGE